MRLRDIGKAHQGNLGPDGLSDLAHTAAAPFALCRRPFWTIIRLEPGPIWVQRTHEGSRCRPAWHQRIARMARRPSLKQSAPRTPLNGFIAFGAVGTPGVSSNTAPTVPGGAACRKGCCGLPSSWHGLPCEDSCHICGCPLIAHRGDCQQH